MADRFAFQTDKAELSATLFLWRECEFHQDSNHGHTDYKPAIILVQSLLERNLSFSGLATMFSPHVLSQPLYVLQSAGCRHEKMLAEVSESPPQLDEKE